MATSTSKSAARKTPAKKATAKKATAKKATAKKSARKTTAAKKTTSQSPAQKATRQVHAQRRQTTASFGRLADDASGFASQVGHTAQAVAKSAKVRASSAFNTAREYVHDHPAQAAAIASTAIAVVGAVATRKKWPGIARTAALAAPLAAGTKMLAEVSSKIRR